MKKAVLVIGLILWTCLPACAEPAEDGGMADYGLIRSDFSGMTPEIAEAYGAVMDELSEHLGYDVVETAEKECLYSGFVYDLDEDGTLELCLLLRLNPRESDDWNAAHLYGWIPPMLRIYTYQDRQAVRVRDYDLYFATVGREAAMAALITGQGMQFVWWDRMDSMDEGDVYYYEFEDGTMQMEEAPANVKEASKGAKSAEGFLDALGTDKAQLLMHNRSGITKIEGEANAQELRAALVRRAENR